MIRIFSILLLLSFVFVGNAQTKKIVWSKARILLSGQKTMKDLARLGVEVDHGLLKPGQFFESAFSERELKKIKEAGFSYDILIKDVALDFLIRNQNPVPPSIQTNFSDKNCDRVKLYTVPQNWSLGSMGGHLRYEEMLAHLDSMRAKFPNLISIREAIDTTKTIEGRTIWSVRISDNPDISEADEPQALFSAIHHAREPVGMHQLIFFMWYLLENHGVNSEIKKLVNESALYFVPCLNPDGYIYNQTSDPNGGGMWRKNRREHLDLEFGVDLNRNYGHQWGYDDEGSGNESFMETYRGTSAFSEPETRAMKAFCENHKFIIAQNYHTYSNVILHPWGFENLQCDDSSNFRSLVGEMARENTYKAGTCLEVLTYTANGTSDDYMYHTVPDKDKILAITPEVGDWFWPTSAEIQGLCLETIHQNLTQVRALHPMVSVKDSTGKFLSSQLGSTSGPYRFRYWITRLGILPNSNNQFSLNLRAISSNGSGLPTLNRQYNSTQLSANKPYLDSLVFSEGLSILSQDQTFSFELMVSNGLFETRDTLVFQGGSPQLRFQENCDLANSWTGSWIISNQNPKEGIGCLASNEGTYTPNLYQKVTRKRFFDLRNPEINTAIMSFWTQYSLEPNFDYAMMSLSSDSGLTWTNMCSNATHFSSTFTNQGGVSPLGADSVLPIWDGFQTKWRKEYVDLQGFIGKKVWMRFVMKTDEAGEFGGFRIDDIRVLTNEINTSVTSIGDEKMGFRLDPNPGAGKAKFIRSGTLLRENGRLSVFNSLGQRVHFQDFDAVEEGNLQTNLSKGLYWVKWEGERGTNITQTWMIQ